MQKYILHRRLSSQVLLPALILVAMAFTVKQPTATAYDPTPTATPTTIQVGVSARGQTQGASANLPNAISLAPGYCSSVGGSTEFERITNAILTPNGDGTMKLQVNVFIANPEHCVAGQECPSYDASPEHVNAWIDWNGDKQWDASERVLDKDLTGYLAINYAGTMTGVGQFAIPATFSETTWLRANVGYLYDPNSACEASWAWGNVLDQPVFLRAPQIKTIKATGSKDVNNPMTTYDVKLEAVVDTPSDFEVTQVNWSGDLKPGTGNPYTYKPDKGTHGKKKIKATVTFKNKSSGAIGQISKELEFKLFFEKNGDDNGDGKPNWFDYWGSDGAVPGLTNPKVTYDATKGASSYGAWSPASDNVELGLAASATHYPGGLTIDGTTYGNVRGIDSVSEVIAHELRHRTTIKVNWEAGGPWVGKADADFHVPTNAYYDKLPNEYEDSFGTDKTKTDSKDLEHKKSAVYKYYGDNEFDAIVAGHGNKGIADKDWANPGKQSNPAFVSAATAEEAQTNAASGLLTAASQFQNSEVVLPDLAQLSGAYTDAGVDTDNNGQYEALRLTVGVNITASATYQLVGWLQNGAASSTVWAYTSANLSPGLQQMQLDFDGKLLNLLGKNGSYRLRHIELRTGDDGDVVDFANDVYITTAYTATDFVMPTVTYTGIYADGGMDSNSNGLFDTLNITVGVQMNGTGNYTLVGWLYTADGSAIPGAVATTAFNSSGTQTLQFDGKSIRWQRKNGPYTLRYLEVRDTSQERVAFSAQAYTTSTAYLATQFESGGTAELDATGYTDGAIDLNSDGLFDLLRISSTISVTTPGLYQVSASLRDQAGQTITDIAEEVVLITGTNTTVLDFPGGLIRQHGADGPYQLTQVLLTTQAGEAIDQQAFAGTTQPYTATDFAFPLVTLAGDFQDAAVDTDHDGQKDYLNVSVPIQPGNSGVVIAQGRLVDKNDQEIQWLETNVTVTAGVAQTVTLPFSATQILSHGVDGPYLLKDILIYHTGDPNQAISNLPAYVTAGYRHTDLGLFIGTAATLAINAAPDQLIADGNSTSEITVVVKDASGNLVPNQEIQFSTTLGNLAANSGKTDLDGQVSVNLLAPTTAGQAIATANIGNVRQTVTVTFIVGSPAFITTAITPTLLVADEKSVAAVRAKVTDAFGNPITGQVVNFTTSLGSISASAQTNANGVALASLTASASAGIARVTAQLGALQATTNATFIPNEQKSYLPLIQR
ncbi:MAG: invasin domain 3-containing protein [Caldilineaceae bacterium]